MKASTPTARPEASILSPAPLTFAALDGVAGVLGDIARERSKDYEDAFIKSNFSPFDFSTAPPRPSFRSALAGEGLALITEIKRSSPSQGAIADLDPVVAASDYREGGAAALSILTEERHFGGQLEHLAQVAAVSPLPLLRKDFTVHPQQILEARAAGASAVLLIVAVLGEQTRAYLEYARAQGLDALVEVHDEAELGLALEAGADIVGVNNRDLRTLQIDLGNAPKLIEQAKDKGFDGLLVAESGYRRAEDLLPLRGLADAVLIGTSVAGSGDLRGAVARLKAALA